ncbi:MAG TPA: hypothetical protein VFE13_12845 [Caulobacteraceae bacterium]|nr:hypothetical protein [Caulobacteraceae bacterium]
MRTSVLLGLFAAGLLAGAAQAATPSMVYGKWVERFPDGNGMVTEFSAGSISSYPVDSFGHATAAPTAMPVTYVDLGGEILGVSFKSGGGAMLARRNADAMTMALPGIGSHELTRIKVDAGQSVG